MPVKSPKRKRAGNRVLNVLVVLLVLAILVFAGLLAINLMRGQRSVPKVAVDTAPAEAPVEDVSNGADVDTEPEEEESDPVITVCLDPGHGGKDPGCDYQKDGSTIQEKDETLQMVMAIKAAMEAQGINVILTREDDTFVELEDRAAIANDADADYFISIHRNTLESGQANGIEIYYAPGASEETAAFADNVEAALNEAGVSRDRGVMEASMVVCRLSEMPAILVEMGFVIDDEDNKLFYSNMDAYAQAMTDAVLSSYEAAHSEDAA